MNDDFETMLGSRLATLAEEAVPDDSALGTLDDVPMASVTELDGRRRRAWPMLAVAAAITVIAVGAATLAAQTGDDPDRTSIAAAREARMTSLPASPLSARRNSVAVFTGREVIVWGGLPESFDNGASDEPDARDGAAYNVETHTWRRLPTVSESVLVWSDNPIAVWTGSAMLVVATDTRGIAAAAGDTMPSAMASYDPTTDEWTRLTAPPTCPLSGAWTDNRLVVTGQCQSSSDLEAGTIGVATTYDVASDSWTAANQLPSEELVLNPLLAVGDRIVAWSSEGAGGQVLAPVTGGWTPISAWPGDKLFASIAIPHGDDEIIVVGQREESAGHSTVTMSATYNLTTKAWSSVSSLKSDPPAGPAALNGDLAVWPASPEGFAWYDAENGRTESLRTQEVSDPINRSDAVLVAMGADRFFVWGGSTYGNNRLNDDGFIIDLSR